MSPAPTKTIGELITEHAVAVLTTGLPGVLVCNQRIRPFEPTELPAVNVKMGLERVTYPTQMKRTAPVADRELHLMVRMEAAGDPPATDPLRVLVIQTLMGDRSLGALALGIEEVESQWEDEAGSDATYGVLIIDFAIRYLTAANDPTAMMYAGPAGPVFGPAVIHESDVVGLVADLAARALKSYVDSQDAAEASARLTADAIVLASAEAYTDAHATPLPTGSGNKVLATPPDGSSGVSALRVLVAADVPALAESKVTNLVTDLAARALTTYVDSQDSAEATTRAAADTAEASARIAADALKAAKTYVDSQDAAETARAQAAEALAEVLTHKGAPSGYAGLDSGGHVPLAQLPTSIVGALQYQGVWDASANSPALASGAGTKGFFYKISVTGNTALDGNTNWHIGDLAIFDGTVWDKVDNYEAVTSVAGRVGAVVIAESDVTSLVADLALKAPLASPALTGTPTAPTAALGDDSTTIATTAYVENAIDNMVATDIPAIAESGVTGLVSDLALKAPLASPALTGTPTAPTPAALDNSTKLATTAYDDAAVAVEKTRALAAEALLAPKASPTFTGAETLDNPTAATSTVSQSSPIYTWSGRYWNGSASVSDSWTVQVVLANGTNGASTLTIAHSGTTGAASLSVPGLQLGNGSNATPSLVFASNTALGLYKWSTHHIGVEANFVGYFPEGVATAAFYFAVASSQTIRGVSTLVLGWSSSASDATFGADASIVRLGPASLAIGNGAAGDSSGNISAKTHTVIASSGAPTSAATAGVVGQIIAYGGSLYFCSVTGAAGSATWNKLSMSAV
jgi:hypothetical protein